MICKADVIIFVCAIFLPSCHGAKILGLFHSPSRSHHVLGSVILKALAGRGHEVTMLSPYPLSDPVKNYKDVYLHENLATMEEANEVIIQQLRTKSTIESFIFMLNMTAYHTELVFQNKDVQRLIQSEEKFDLIVMDSFFNEAHFIFGEIFNAPIILLSSFGSTFNSNWIVGNSVPLSYVPMIGTSFTGKMTFFQRVGNVLMYLMGHLAHLQANEKQQKILATYFDGLKQIEDLSKRVALIFSNEHYSFSDIMPSIPNIIEIGGVHVEQPKGLPQDLQTFMDEASEGVIFFSLGSNMKTSFVEPEKFDEIIKCFSALPVKVLMKYESDDLPNQPKNVKFSKWLPQNDILAHPNTKLFISHGGLLSTIEAIYHGVPIIGIPIFGDQVTNVPKAVNAGYALQLDLQDITELSLTTAINEILINPKYKENIKKRSSLLRKSQVKPLDTAIFWVEHVLDYNGADHLQNGSIHLKWYQYLLLDVVAFLLSILILVIAVIYLGLKKLVLRKSKKVKTN